MRRCNTLWTHSGCLEIEFFSARDSSFAADLMRETKGQGVDLAINSLRGAAACHLDLHCRVW